jgi:hypothetical protein
VLTTLPDDYYLANELGTLEKPKINRADDWLGDTKKARAFHQMIWQTQPHIRQLIEYARSAFELGGPAETPRDTAEYQQLIASMIAQGFKDPKWAATRLVIELEQSGRWDAYRTALGGAEPALGAFPPPRSLAEISVLALRYDAEFWAVDGNKEKYLAAHLGWERIDQLGARISACRGFEDLVELERTLA